MLFLLICLKKQTELLDYDSDQIKFTPMSKIPLSQEKLFSRGLTILVIIIACDLILLGIYIYTSWRPIKRYIMMKNMDASLMSMDS